MYLGTVQGAYDEVDDAQVQALLVRVSCCGKLFLLLYPPHQLLRFFILHAQDRAKVASIWMRTGMTAQFKHMDDDMARNDCSQKHKAKIKKIAARLMSLFSFPGIFWQRQSVVKKGK